MTTKDMTICPPAEPLVQKDTVTITPHQEGGFQLQTEQVLPAEISEVFDFFADARQLERITPPWLNFRITTPTPIEIRKGTLIDYRLRLRFIPIRWRTLISEWSPTSYFVDEQLRGPYRLWRHLHEFEPHDDGTLVRDTVHYRVAGGRLVERLFVRSDLRRIFEYRYTQLARIFSEKGEVTIGG